MIVEKRAGWVLLYSGCRVRGSLTDGAVAGVVAMACSVAVDLRQVLAGSAAREFPRA